MPELPDVEKWKRHLDATALHRKVEDVEVRHPDMLDEPAGQRLRTRLKQASFDRTERRGNRLFAQLGRDEWLMLHLGMASRLSCLKEQEPPPEDSDLLIRFADGRGLACTWQEKPGRVGLVDSPDAFVREEKLGPDPLLPGLTLADFRQRLRERRDAVKSALMDEHFIAGIGDHYSDEILYQARIHPRTETRDLSGAQVATLYAAITRVLHIAIGWSADPGRWPSSWLLPHRTRDGVCARCSGRLEQLAIGGHTAFCCPRCQRKSRRRPRRRSGKHGPRG